MVKRRREETDSGGVIYDMTSYKTVFIDTNLDTHLAVIVSDSDTVSDLKRKIMFEHLRCFPEMGELKIPSVKVKRKGHYYHLPDTMLVRCVFEGIKKGWFLSADASRIQCLGNDQGLLCITYPQTEAENLLPSDSFRAMDKQMVFYTTKSYPDHGNLASSSIMKQKFKNVKPMDNSQELSPRSGPMAKKRKTKHKEDALDLPVTDTHTSKHGIDSESEVKVVESDTMSTHFNEGERENINMKLEDVSAEPLRNQPFDPSKVSKLGMKKRRIGGASVEISGVLDELRGNRNNDTLDETSQSGDVANKVKILGSKESSRGSTEFNHRDILKITIPENSTAGKPIKAAAAETLGDQSVRTDTAHKNRKKKGKDSSTCHDEVSGMVLGSTDKFEGARGLEQKEGVEMKIFDKLTDVDSTLHVTQSRLKETSPVKDHGSNKECPAPVSTEFYEMNLVGRPIFESIVSGNNKLVTDVANTTVEQEELIPNCDFEMPVSEKLDEASTRDPVPSYQLGDSQGAAQNSFGRKRSKAKKSTPHQELDMKNIVEASQNAYASDQDIVRHDDSSDATTKVGSIMPKTDVDLINVGKEGKSSVTQRAETSFTSDNNEATRTTKEQILSAKTAFDDKGNIESGNASSTKQKKKSRRKSAEKIPDKLDGEDDSRVNCPSFAAGIGPITDPVTEQSKNGEISLDAGKLQIGLSTEVKGAETSFPSENNEATGSTKEQILSAKTALDDKRNIESGNASSTKQRKKSCRKSAEKIPDKLDGEDDSRVNWPSLAAGIGPITDPVTEKSKKGEISLDAGKLQIGLSTEVKGSSHNKDLVQVHFATCRSSDDAKAEMTIKEVETISTAPSNVKVAEGHGNSGRIKKKKSKKEVSTYINDVSCAPSAMHDPPANHFVKGSTQDKNALPASKKKGASEQVSKSAYAAGSHQQVEKATCIEAELLPTEEKGNEVEQLLLNQTDKNQKTVSIVEKKLKTKTKKSQSSKKGKSILSVQDQEVSHKELAASTDNLGDVNSLPEPMEMNKSGKSSHVDQLAVTKLDNQRNCGINSNFESSRKDVRNADSFRVPSYTLAKGALEEMHEPDVNTDKSDGINFKQYFVLGQHGEVASKKPTKSNRDTKAGSKSKDTMTSRGTSEDIMNSRIEVALPSRSSAQGDKTLEETGKLATFDAPAYKKKSEESMDESMSSSSSKGSDRVPEDNRWQTGSETQSLATRKTKMRTGNIEDFTQPKKGLPPTPGPKFWGSRSRRSDSKGGGNSDSTTETPSDYSSSSGSVEGSEISQAETPNGANVAKCNDDGAKHKLKSNLLGQDITMDMILRSSIRFKKAKVTAAKCQDEESQPVDIVPDSLADTPNQ